MMRIGMVVLAAVAGLLGWQVLVRQSSEAAGLLPYMIPERVAAGEALYDANCAGCHGADLSGQENWRERDADGYLPAPPHDESGHTWHHPDAQLFMITKFGTEAIVGQGYKSRMAGFGDVLSDEEIRDVLAYIKSTWPMPVVRRHNQINAQSGG